MNIGIVVCGLNGAGKSTLGKALASALDAHFIDIEALYFPKADSDYLYSSARTHEEVSQALLAEVEAHERFVLACVRGNYGEALYPFLQYAVYLEVPKDIRMHRIENRSFKKFGSRMLPGGDLYEKELAFFELAKGRSDDIVKEWLQALNCPVIQADGTRSIQENVAFILGQIRD